MRFFNDDFFGRNKVFRVSFHKFFKAEHFIGTLIGCCFSVFLRRIRLRVHSGEKLNGVKTAFVDIKMNIALFKIWRAGRPDLGFGVQSFHGKPSAIADAFAVFLRRNEKKFQLVVMCLFVDFQHHTANLSAIIQNSICLAVGCINALLNRRTGNDFAVLLKMIVPQPELFHRTILERLLIIKNELLTVIRFQRGKGYFCVLHNYLRKIKIPGHYKVITERTRHLIRYAACKACALRSPSVTTLYLR